MEKLQARAQDYSLLGRPVVTEKSSYVGSGGSCLTFKVAPKATKTQIREAVERVFGVKVAKVRTCNYLGKIKRTPRGFGRRANFKKAYVMLGEGESVDILSGV